jgi:hypothetical protein
VVIAVQALRLPRRHGLRDLLWWVTGTTVTLAADRLEGIDPLGGQAWYEAVSSMVYVAALAVLFAATLGADPLLFVVPRRRRDANGSPVPDWLPLRAVVPLLVGLLGAYLAGVWWLHVLEKTRGVESEFFA